MRKLSKDIYEIKHFENIGQLVDAFDLKNESILYLGRISSMRGGEQKTRHRFGVVKYNELIKIKTIQNLIEKQKELRC